METPPRGFTIEQRNGRWSLRARIAGVRVRIAGESYEQLLLLAKELAKAESPDQALLLIHRNETLHDVFLRWLVEYAPLTLEDPTGEMYIGTYGRYIEQPLGRVRAQLVRGIVLQRWADRLPELTGRPTAKKAFSVLGSILRFATLKGIIPDNPMGAVEFPEFAEEAPEQIRAPTPTFVEYVLSLLEREDDKLVVELLAYEGCRQEEAIAATKGAVRLTPGLLFVDRTIVRGRHWHIKNRRPHSVPLLASPRARLTARLRHMSVAEPGTLLISSRTGDPWTPTDCAAFRRRFARAARQVSGGAFTPRDLRAHYVTMMIESGTPPDVVAEHIGDNVETVLRHYYRVRDDPDRALPPDEQITRARARVAEAPIIRNSGGRPKRRREAA